MHIQKIKSRGILISLVGVELGVGHRQEGEAHYGLGQEHLILVLVVGER